MMPKIHRCVWLDGQTYRSKTPDVAPFRAGRNAPGRMEGGPVRPPRRRFARQQPRPRLPQPLQHRREALRDAHQTVRPQGCFKIGVLRTPIWEAAVGDGFAGPPPYTATRRLGRHAIADSLA